jgi:hypothetical protein
VAMMSPRKAFSLATRGGLKLDCAFSKYCIGAMVIVGWLDMVLATTKDKVPLDHTLLTLFFLID